MIDCPVCESGTREVSVRANPGTLIVLDQCPRCGGIWCDQWELYPVDPAEAENLDPLNDKAFNAPPDLQKRVLYCPRCKDKLAIFRDRLLPSEIQLRRCARCQGIWLNRGQFGSYKRFQKKTRAEKLSNEDRIQRLARATYNPKSWVTTGTRGIFAYPAGETEGDDWRSNTAKGAVQLILQTLLRLALGR
jgi:Zn-finger nucleic acid-binding protein